AFDDAGGGLVEALGGGGDPEVGDLHFAFEGQQHVLRGDVAVDDAERPAVGPPARVGEVQTRRDFGDQRERQRRLDPAVLGGDALVEVVEVHALHELHRDEV